MSSRARIQEFVMKDLQVTLGHDPMDDHKGLDAVFVKVSVKGRSCRMRADQTTHILNCYDGILQDVFKKLKIKVVSHSVNITRNMFSEMQQIRWVVQGWTPEKYQELSDILEEATKAMRVELARGVGR